MGHVEQGHDISRFDPSLETQTHIRLLWINGLITCLKQVSHPTKQKVKILNSLLEIV